MKKMTGKATARLEISAESLETAPGRRMLAQAAEVLHAGGTVAFPTETVYGLGANALDAHAVEGIFTAKQRPSWDPLIVHVSGRAMLERVVAEVPARAQKLRIERLMDAFWPGPLTLLLPRLAEVPDAVTAGRPLVGVRIPAHPVARALVAAADLPVAAPSANRFGHTSPTTAQHVLDDLDGRIDLLLDGGPTRCGVESTVIEVGEDSIILYRPGAVTAEEIEVVAGPVVSYEPPEILLLPEALPSPGVGIRHYAPNAAVIPVDVGLGTEVEQRARWLCAVRGRGGDGMRVGVMVPLGWPLPEDFSGFRYEWGSWGENHQLARRLFAGLRALDGMDAEIILCPLPGCNGLGMAIVDRLLKAARVE
jgi:L-threonylcarbamoyladenylate synthase